MKTLQIVALTAIVLIGLGTTTPTALSSGYSGAVALPFGVLTYGDGDLSLIPLLENYYSDSRDYVLNPNYYETFPEQRKVIGGESLSELQDVIEKAAKLPYAIDSVAYDIEHWDFTPISEQNNVPVAVHSASVIAHEAGYRFVLAPDMQYLLDNYEEIDWNEVDMLVIQGQLAAKDTSIFSEIAWNVSSHVKPINPDIEIFAQVSLSRTDANQTISAIGSVKGFIDGIIVLYQQNGDGTCQYCTEINLNKVLMFITTTSASPIANAGPDRISADESVVKIDGRASFDPDGSPLIYSWNQIGGYPVNLTDTKSAQLQLQTPKVQSDRQLTFRLTVTDGSGASATDDIALTVKNLGPYNTALSIGLAQKIIPWGKSMTITGKLVDLELTRSGIPGRVISISGTGVFNNVIYAVTDADGKFTVSFPTPNTVGAGWTVQARFAGDTNYLSSDSTVNTFDTVKHETRLYFGVYPSEIATGKTFTVKIKLNDKATGAPLSSKTIVFTTSSPLLTISDVITDSTGTYTLKGLVAPGIGTYTIQANFRGDAMYGVSSSSSQTLTVK